MSKRNYKKILGWDNFSIKEKVEIILSDRKTSLKIELAFNKADLEIIPFILNSVSQVEYETFVEALYVFLHGPAELCQHGEKLKFQNLLKGYNRFCGKTSCPCFSTFISKKITESSKAKTIEHKIITQQRRSKTCLKKYGTSIATQADDIKQKTKETNLKRYGGHPSQNKDIKYKTNQTCSEKYGSEYAISSTSIRKKIKKTNLEKYGVEHSGQIIDFHKKAEKTNIKRYGSKNVSSSEKIKEKKRNTSRQTFGVDHYMKCPQGLQIHKNSIIKKYGVSNISQINVPQESLDIIQDKNKFSTFCIDKTLRQISSELQMHPTTVGKYVNIHKCRDVIIFKPTQSEEERLLGNWIESLGIDIVRQDRQIISPKELDIFIPDKKLAIEYCGMYWHSELVTGRDKYYHISKMNECKEKGIQLITIFEDEFISNPEKIKNTILYKLGMTRKKIYARQTKIIELQTEVAHLFLEKYHIQGKINSSLYIGLEDKDGSIRAVMSFGKNRFNNQNSWEILRFCTDNSSIPGALSKLLNYFLMKTNCKKISTYVDLRYGNSNGYKSIGFEEVRTTIGFNYVNSTTRQRYNRMNFQKHKLVQAGYDPAKTEWEIMQELGYDRIWDCGQMLLEKEI